GCGWGAGAVGAATTTCGVGAGATAGCTLVAHPTVSSPKASIAVDRPLRGLSIGRYSSIRSDRGQVYKSNAVNSYSLFVSGNLSRVSDFRHTEFPGTPPEPDPHTA